MLVYTETENEKFKKSSLQLVSFSKSYSEKTIAVTFNCNSPETLFKYGADKIININHPKLNAFNAKTYAACLQQIAQQESQNTILLSSSSSSKYIAPILSINWNAALIPSVFSHEQDGSFKKVIFSSKVISKISTSENNKVITLANNSLEAKENNTNGVIETFTPSLSDDIFNGLKILETTKSLEKVSITEAKIVVSGGRGLKGPENWHILEDLASSLGAATACTKPVSDMGWRPHSEHVGQTGKPVSSDIYIAIGISGAIQHLAGVNSSKNKIVINNDPEAPFFKSAEYGIVGDAFEIVPKLTKMIKEYHQ